MGATKIKDSVEEITLDLFQNCDVPEEGRVTFDPEYQFVGNWYFAKWHLANPVAHSPLKVNFEETKTVKSYFSCSLFSLLGYWVVLEPLRAFIDLLVRQVPFHQVQIRRQLVTLRNGSIMSQLSYWRRFPTAQITHKLRRCISITRLVAG